MRYTTKDYYVENFYGFSFFVKAGAPTTHRTATGIDEKYNFLCCSWKLCDHTTIISGLPEWCNGQVPSGLQMDIDNHGINIPEEYFESVEEKRTMKTLNFKSIDTMSDIEVLAWQKLLSVLTRQYRQTFISNGFFQSTLSANGTPHKKEYQGKELSFEYCGVLENGILVASYWDSSEEEHFFKVDVITNNLEVIKVTETPITL